MIFRVEWEREVTDIHECVGAVGVPEREVSGLGSLTDSVVGSVARGIEKQSIHVQQM